MPDYPSDEPQKLWHPMITAALALAIVAVFAVGGYKVGLDHAKIRYVDVPGPTQYVDVPGPERIVKEPYEVKVEVPVPGPVRYVDLPVPGPTVVKKIFVTKPRHCPSVADALNEYEAVSRL